MALPCQRYPTAEDIAKDVQTYVQSGNVVFRSELRSAAAVERRLTAIAAEHLSLETEFFVRTAAEWAVVVESNPPYRLVTKVKETEKMFGGTWTIAIASEAQGSALTITEDGWVGNPIFRLMAKYLFGHHATIDGILKEVAKTLGEEPRITGV